VTSWTPVYDETGKSCDEILKILFLRGKTRSGIKNWDRNLNQDPEFDQKKT